VTRVTGGRDTGFLAGLSGIPAYVLQDRSANTLQQKISLHFARDTHCFGRVDCIRKHSIHSARHLHSTHTRWSLISKILWTHRTRTHTLNVENVDADQAKIETPVWDQQRSVSVYLHEFAYQNSPKFLSGPRFVFELKQVCTEFVDPS